MHVKSCHWNVSINRITYVFLNFNRVYAKRLQKSFLFNVHECKSSFQTFFKYSMTTIDLRSVIVARIYTPFQFRCNNVPEKTTRLIPSRKMKRISRPSTVTIKHNELSSVRHGLSRGFPYLFVTLALNCLLLRLAHLQDVSKLTENGRLHLVKFSINFFLP